MNLQPFEIKFVNKCKAIAVKTGLKNDVSQLVSTLKLTEPKGILVLSGGSDFMEEKISERMKPVFQFIAKFIKKKRLCVIDGGTQRDIMSLMGEWLAKVGLRAAYVGVLPAYAAANLDGKTAEDVLEPHHSHFVLLESGNWGDEVPTMYKLIRYLAKQAPTVVLLINGGPITLQEMQHAVSQRHNIIVFAGSEGLADEIVQAIQQPKKQTRKEILDLVTYGNFTIFDLADSPRKLKSVLKKSLSLQT